MHLFLIPTVEGQTTNASNFENIIITLTLAIVVIIDNTPLYGITISNFIEMNSTLSIGRLLSDSVGSYSGHGDYEGYGGYGGYGGYCPEGIPVEFALLSILAAFGVSFGILYRALTLKVAGRSSSRSVLNAEELGCNLGELGDLSSSLIFQYIPDLIWSGKYHSYTTVFSPY